MNEKAQVGAMSTHDDPNAPKVDTPVTPAQAPPKPADVPEGNQPVDVQETQAEHDRKKPVDQP